MFELSFSLDTFSIISFFFPSPVIEDQHFMCQEKEREGKCIRRMYVQRKGGPSCSFFFLFGPTIMSQWPNQSSD